MFMGLYEGSTQRGYIGSFAGNAQDVDFGTNTANTSGRVHLTTRAIPRLTIDSVGKVGIGTTAAIAQLDIVNPASYYGIWVKNTFLGNVDHLGIYAQSVNAPGWGIGVQAYGGFRGVYGVAEGGNSGGVSVGVYGYASGNPGYGSRYGVLGSTTGGSNAYGVFGRAGNATSFNAAGYFVGDVHATSFITTSDRRFKQDIQPVEHGLEQVLKLKPTTYTFKTTEFNGMHLPEGRQLGLIADEVKEVFPELVQQAVHPAEYDKEDRTKVISPEVKYEGVNYQGLIPVLIASVQQLNEKDKEIDELKEENKNIKERLMKLETLLTSGNNAVSLTSTYLEQNTPNPVQGSTIIRYHVPEASKSARLTLTNVKGQVMKTMTLNNRGTGQVNLNTQGFAAGTYNYTLYVDGRQVDIKRLVVTR
jgi:hypothetical protein